MPYFLCVSGVQLLKPLRTVLSLYSRWKWRILEANSGLVSREKHPACVPVLFKIRGYELNFPLLVNERTYQYVHWTLTLSNIPSFPRGV